MKPLKTWTVLASLALTSLMLASPVTATAQTKAKKAVKSTAKKASKSKSVRRTAKPQATTTTRKLVVPKSGVMNTGAFRPLKNSDRIQIVLPRRPAVKSDMSGASNRRTVYTNRTVTPSANTLRMVTQTSYPSTALIINNPRSNWWGYGGPPSTTIYDSRYGWITSVAYSWGNVLYTYGYQVVNFWNGEDYVWYSYPGVAGVAYPVLYR